MRVSVVFLLFVGLLVPLVLCVAPAGEGEYETLYHGPYGVPSGTFADYYERTLLLWINMARVDPNNFKASWVSPIIQDGSSSNIFNSGYSATDAVTWNLDLNRVARAHSVDIATTPGCLQNAGHNDCNTTLSEDRLAKWYTQGYEGEILWAYSVGWNHGGSYNNLFWPFYAVAGWICDGSLSTGGTLLNCPEDGELAGHRDVIMTGTGEVGCGHTLGKTTDGKKDVPVTTCDFGAAQTYHSSVIATGAHIFLPDRTGSTIRFIAVVSTSYVVKGMKTIIDGEIAHMTLYSGVSNRGSYRVATDYIMTGCSKYWFEALYTNNTHGDVVERYPREGAFYTFGTSDTCNSDWTADTTTPSSSEVVTTPFPQDDDDSSASSLPSFISLILSWAMHW